MTGEKQLLKQLKLGGIEEYIAHCRKAAAALRLSAPRQESARARDEDSARAQALENHAAAAQSYLEEQQRPPKKWKPKDLLKREEEKARVMFQRKEQERRRLTRSNAKPPYDERDLPKCPSWDVMTPEGNKRRIEAVDEEWARDRCNRERLQFIARAKY